ncbi:exo-alpha-sialidase [bacterium]|nr:exo-alpha-sialidase [bacterium]
MMQTPFSIFSAKFALFCALSVSLFRLPGVAWSQADLTAQFIFQPDKLLHGHTHASSLVECPNGDLLACWYEGATDKSADVHIQAARLRKGGEWGDPFLLADTPMLSDNNPCMIIDRQNRLWLFYYTLLGGSEQPWETAFLRFKQSCDYENLDQPILWNYEADLPVLVPNLDTMVARLCEEPRWITWDADELCRKAQWYLRSQLSRRLGWTTRARPLILRSGELLLPMASEIFGIATMAITSDQGRSWFFSQPPMGYGVEQPTVFERSDGVLVAYFRDSTSLHRIRTSISQDFGRTWSPIIASEWPNPGSGLEVLRLRNGHVVLIYNDVENDPRSRLAVSLSLDEGKTWPYTRHLEDSPEGRFDYPSLLQTRDNRLHAVYSYNVQTIKHVSFSEAWIMEQQ